MPQETPVVEEQQPTQTDVQTQDPFQVDEAVMATLTPEQRQSLEPVLSTWKQKAQETIKSENEKLSQRYKNYDEFQKKANVFDQLTNDQRFQQWWRQLTNPQSSPQQQQQAQQNVLRSIGSSNDEYALAVQEAAAGDPTKLNDLNMRIQSAWAKPLLQKIDQQYSTLEAKIELDGLFKRYPDADKLNNIVDPKSGMSLLQVAAQAIVDSGRGTWEDAYQFARHMYDSARSESKNEALGIVRNKKESVSEGGPKQSRESSTTVQVDSPDKALNETIRAVMQGRNNVNYVSKQRFGSR